MLDRRSIKTTIIKIVVLTMILVSQILIFHALLKPIYIGKDGNSLPIYLDNDYTVTRVITAMSMFLIILLIVYQLFRLTKKDNRLFDNKRLLIVEMVILFIILVVNIVTLVIFPFKYDSKNNFASGFSLANVIIIATYILTDIYLMLHNKANNINSKITVAIVAEGSVLAALSIVLSLISKLIPGLELPNGGSFSLSMLPLFIFAFRRGAKAGFLLGLVYGIINMITDGYTIIHLGVPFLDYLIPFSMLTGVAGLFSKQAQAGEVFYIVIGVILGSFLRYICHSLSGVIFFSEYAGETNVFLYSFILYNLPYMFVSTLGTLISVILLRKELIFTDTRIR